MKINATDTDLFTRFELTPESMSEIAYLLRMATNSKREPPDIYLSFSSYNTNGVPYMLIRFAKVKPSNQKNSIKK